MNQQQSCLGNSCATSGKSVLETSAEHSKTTGFYEEDDEDDGQPFQKPETGRSTFGASLAQAEVKRESSTEFYEEEVEDSAASSQQRQPRKSVHTNGMMLLQHGMKVAANKNR